MTSFYKKEKNDSAAVANCAPGKLSQTSKRTRIPFDKSLMKVLSTVVDFFMKVQSKFE
jgi:hypothetical protein